MIFSDVIELFYGSRDPGKAFYMAKYMKDQFPFLGLAKPVRAKLQAAAVKQAGQNPAITWDDVFFLWNMPEREFQYLAMDYLQTAHRYLQESDLDHLQRLITSKSWWDTVDMLASNIVGPLCARFPGLVWHIQGWSRSDNLWLVRSAILFQLKYKDRTDAALLGSIIAANSRTREFFINKAIGWALREYSKTDPIWVRAFLEQNQLHPLSLREAGKYL